MANGIVIQLAILRFLQLVRLDPYQTQTIKAFSILVRVYTCLLAAKDIEALLLSEWDPLSIIAVGWYCGIVSTLSFNVTVAYRYSFEEHKKS